MILSSLPFILLFQSLRGKLTDLVKSSQVQFFLTDSLNHFIFGALYFYKKPNYDSIMPAINYRRRYIKINGVFKVDRLKFK